jgi:hypothetical protein
MFSKLIIWNIDIHTCLLDITFLCPHLPSGNTCNNKKKNSSFHWRKQIRNQTRWTGIVLLNMLLWKRYEIVFWNRSCFVLFCLFSLNLGICFVILYSWKIAELAVNSNHSPNLLFDSLKNITEYTFFTIKKDINIYI